MRRVLVSGVSGAGKTTLARRIAERCDIPRYELDALHHGPGWVKRPEFEQEVEGFSGQVEWVTEDQYQSLIGLLLWKRADTVVLLDLPRALVMRRVVARSVWRAFRRTELWNGNRERWGYLLTRGHPIRYAWRMHGPRRARALQLAAEHPHVTFVRLRSAREVHAWVETLSGADEVASLDR